MRLDPVRQRLRPGRFGVGVVGGAQHRDEDLGVAYLAGDPIDDADLLARVVDEHLVAGHVVLAHHRGQPPLELPIKIAKARVAIAIRIGLAVLLPQHHQVDARPLELARQCRPVRLAVPAPAGLDAAAGKQPLLDNLVGPLDRQRPADPGRLRPPKIVLDRAACHPERAPDLPGAHAIVVQPQHLPQLPHGQLSFGRHQVLLPDDRGGLMPESLTRRKNAANRYQVAGFKSERWPDSSRNAGRLQIGTPAGFASEYPAGINRNPHLNSFLLGNQSIGIPGEARPRDSGSFRAAIAQSAV